MHSAYIAHLGGADEFGYTPVDLRWIAAPMLAGFQSV